MTDNITPANSLQGIAAGLDGQVSTFQAALASEDPRRIRQAAGALMASLLESFAIVTNWDLEDPPDETHLVDLLGYHYAFARLSGMYAEKCSFSEDREHTYRAQVIGSRIVQMFEKGER